MEDRSSFSVEFLGEFGALLRAVRKERRVRQIDLGLDVGVHDSIVSRWEGGVLYPTIDQLYAVRRSLVLDDDAFGPLYFAWKREAESVPPVFAARGHSPKDLIEFTQVSIALARTMRRSGQPRTAVILCARDVEHVLDRLRELRWSSLHPTVVAQLAELLVEQCKAALDYVPRVDVRNGALRSVLARLQVLEQVSPSPETAFFGALATEGATYVGGDVELAFEQSMRLINGTLPTPGTWRPEVLRAAAINAGKVKDREALTRVEEHIQAIMDGLSGSGAAFLLEGLARGWSNLDLVRARAVIERAWDARRTTTDIESGSQLRHVQLVRSELEIALADHDRSGAKRILEKAKEGLAISEANGYDRYADQLGQLLKKLD